MIKIPEDTDPKFKKVFGLFKRKEKTLPSKELEKPIPEKTEIEEKKSEKVEEEVEEKEEVKPEEKVPEKELKEKYGVIKEIPEREVVEEIPTLKKTKYPKEEGEVKLSDLLLRIEKMDGKLDIIDRFRNDMDERSRQLSEEIGELRTMIMERERSFDRIKTDFEKVKDTVSGLEPMKLRKTLDKREMEIMENKAKLEKIETLVRALGEENKKFRALMNKIKSFENLVDISYDIDRKLSKIKEVKDYADKIASKSENVFSELNMKVSELENQKEKIAKLDELTIELTKMLDEVTLRLTRFVEKKDLREFEEDSKEKFEKLKSSLLSDFEKLKTYSPTETSAKKQGQPSVAKTEISELYSRIAKLKSVVEGQNAIVKNIIERLDKTPGIEVKTEAGIEAGSIRNIKLSLRFFQILNILPYVRESNRVKEYLSELREIIEEMKSVGLWDAEKDMFMKDVFSRLSKGFESRGLKELGKIYAQGINV